MRSIVNMFGAGQGAVEAYARRVQSADFVRTRGTIVTPQPPRDVFCQASSRGFLVTWKLPNTKNFDIDGWRVYKNDENNLFSAITDRGIRQCFVEATAGATPTSVNVFVSSINALGVESRKIQSQGKATAEAGAPTVPTVPPGYTAEDSGGKDQSGSLGHGDNGGFLTL